MKFVLGLAAALAFGTIGAVATPAMAKGGNTTLETGSNATGVKGAGAGTASSGKAKPKKIRKKPR